MKFGQRLKNIFRTKTTEETLLNKTIVLSKEDLYKAMNYLADKYIQSQMSYKVSDECDRLNKTEYKKLKKFIIQESIKNAISNR